MRPTSLFHASGIVDIPNDKPDGDELCRATTAVAAFFATKAQNKLISGLDGDHAFQNTKPRSGLFPRLNTSTSSGRRLVTITPALITIYVQNRQAPHKLDDSTEIAGATNGTINRELSTLSKLLRLAFEHGKLQRQP